MDKSSIFPVDPQSPLEDLRRVIEDKETYTGSLLALSPYQQQATWLTFARDKPPGKAIVLRELDNATTPPAVPGHELICIGDGYVNGKATAIAVYRKA